MYSEKVRLETEEERVGYIHSLRGKNTRWNFTCLLAARVATPKISNNTNWPIPPTTADEIMAEVEECYQEEQTPEYKESEKIRNLFQELILARFNVSVAKLKIELSLTDLYLTRGRKPTKTEPHSFDSFRYQKEKELKRALTLTEHNECLQFAKEIEEADINIVRLKALNDEK